MDLKEAKNTLEANSYERRLVYKLSYMKDDTWKEAFFDDKDDAYTMVGAMEEINAKVKMYKYITVHKWSWEIFVEP